MRHERKLKGDKNIVRTKIINQSKWLCDKSTWCFGKYITEDLSSF